MGFIVVEGAETKCTLGVLDVALLRRIFVGVTTLSDGWSALREAMTVGLLGSTLRDE